MRGEYMPPNKQPANKVNPAIISVILIVIIGAVAAGVYLLTNSDTESTSASQTAQADSSSNDSPQQNISATEPTSGEYADGTYTKTGSYSTPGGTESVTVTATLTGGNVSEISATGSARGGNSAQFQSQFLGAFKQQVVGKDIDDVSLSRVSGSSLTSNGFNEAIAQIKRDAQS